MYYWLKPKNLKYTDMCKWIDEHAWDQECDQVQLYNYLYGLVLMLAWKWKYFEKSYDYDDFSRQTASQVFCRLINRNKRRIKYILPYLKKSLRFFKIRWVSNYSIESNPNDFKNEDVMYSIRDNVSGGIDKCDFQIYIDDISSAICNAIRHIPREIGGVEYDNIKISCLLTFINQITPSKSDFDRLMQLTNSIIYDTAYKRIFDLTSKSKPILYHLDDSYSSYIMLLVNVAKIHIRNELLQILDQSIPTIDAFDLVEDKSDCRKFEEIQ